MAVASSTTAPASTFVTSRVATPLAAVAVPRPDTLPGPLVSPNVTTVELSPVTEFPAASRTVAVSVLSAPETLEPERVSSICAAAPCRTVYVAVPPVRPVDVAERSTPPVSAFVTVLVAIPAAAVAVPSPVTLPAPPVCANVTTVELSAVTVLPAASSIVAVSVWSSPETLEPEWLSSIAAAAPCTTV